MPSNKRVLHEVRGFSMRMGQVLKAIEKNGSFVWVKYGETFRDATPAEAVAMQKEQARLNEGLTYLVVGKDRFGKDKLIAKPYFAEIPGIKFEHNGAGGEMRIAREANLWATNRTWLIEEMQ